MSDSEKGRLGPFAAMSDAEKADCIDTIANQGIGEISVMQQTGAEPGHVAEFMLDNGYDRCSRCDWWMEVSACDVINDECVCEDCYTDEESEERD